LLFWCWWLLRLCSIDLIISDYELQQLVVVIIIATQWRQWW